MAAQTQARNKGSGCLLALLTVCAVIVFVAVPALNQHAKQRHGAHAVSALHYMNRHTPEPEDDDEQFWTGTDANGRTYRVLKLKKLAGHPATWSIVIVVGGVLVTAFLAQSKRTVDRIKDQCQ